MTTENQFGNNIDYHINNTKYTVKPIFVNTTTTENIEDKIERLILQECA